MQLSWRRELPQLALIAAMFIAAVCLWPFAPQRMPVHWNIHGEVDRYGGRFAGLLLLPLVTLGVYVLMLVLPRFDPRAQNYAKFAGVYLAIRLTLLAFLAVIYGVTVAAGLGYQVDVGAVVTLGVGALFMVLGGVMPRIQPNWFVGIRTPWTLSSDLSWQRTHRLGGWLFLVLGPLVALLGIVHTAWYFGLVFLAGTTSLVALFWYSYRVYQDDPDAVQRR